MAVLVLLAAAAFFFVGRRSSDSADSLQAVVPIPTKVTTDAWATVAPPGQGFSVEVPGKPVEKSEAKTNLMGITIQEHTIEASTRDRDVFILYFTMGPGVTWDLDEGTQAVIKKFTVSDFKVVEYAGNPARDFTLEDGGSRGRGRTILIGQKVFILIVAAGPERKDEAEADFIKLVNSLKIG